MFQKTVFRKLPSERVTVSNFRPPVHKANRAEHFISFIKSSHPLCAGWGAEGWTKKWLAKVTQCGFVVLSSSSQAVPTTTVVFKHRAGFWVPTFVSTRRALLPRLWVPPPVSLSQILCSSLCIWVDVHWNQISWVVDTGSLHYTHASRSSCPHADPPMQSPRCSAQAPSSMRGACGWWDQRASSWGFSALWKLITQVREAKIRLIWITVVYNFKPSADFKQSLSSPEILERWCLRNIKPGYICDLGLNHHGSVPVHSTC